ncbi:hypothetical protein HNP48_006857 [Acidovorax soli]|uniref:Regulator of chromosome condensation (RCC1) repeat-containing protein n=1 Tax=Acidovorax soli TaxID=592050 RepID=A0A7X0PLQ6_9BURK|nr:regulator [Acidovorax soli]MBB6564131.1 hypothetical protein [Acidovorax soli]
MNDKSHPFFAPRPVRRLLAIAAVVLPAALLPPAAMATTVTLSMGYGHGCSVSDTGQPTCWGSLAVQPLPYEAYASEVRVGRGFSCARAGVAVRCWGSNALSQLGVPIDEAPWGRTLRGLRQVAQIAVGAQHACATDSDDLVSCWGDGSQGQIGHAVATTTAEALRVEGMSQIVQVAAGRASTCGVGRHDHKVVCVGAGSGLAGAAEDPRAPRTVPGISDALEVSLFDSHACVLRYQGKVSCWGSNQHGELGLPASSGLQTTPVEVTHLAAAAKGVAVGSGYSCALLVNGAVQCWGNNAHGQLGTALGDGTGRVTGITDATAISAGQTAACAVLQGGYVQCWGEGTGWSSAPCRVPGGLYPGHPASWGPTVEPAICRPQGAAAPMAVQGLGAAGDAAQVMDWAETTLPQTFAAPQTGGTAPDAAGSMLHLRRYPGGHALAVNAHGTPHLLYQGPLGEAGVLDLGPLGRWLDEARQDEGLRSGMQLQAVPWLDSMPAIAGWPCRYFRLPYGIRGGAGGLPEDVLTTAVRVQIRGDQALELPTGPGARGSILTTPTDWVEGHVPQTGFPVPPGRAPEVVISGSAAGCPAAVARGDMVDVTVLYTLGQRKGLLRTRAQVR